VQVRAAILHQEAAATFRAHSQVQRAGPEWDASDDVHRVARQALPVLRQARPGLPCAAGRDAKLEDGSQEDAA
jgi:hypothetical protein